MKKSRRIADLPPEEAVLKRKKATEYRKRWYAENPDVRRQKWQEWKLARAEKKAGRCMPNNCEACGRSVEDTHNGRLYFDHDHNTGAFRGWICSQCNTALGLSGDSPENLLKLALYLESHKRKS